MSNNDKRVVTFYLNDNRELLCNFVIKILSRLQRSLLQNPLYKKSKKSTCSWWQCSCQIWAVLARRERSHVLLQCVRMCSHPGETFCKYMWSQQWQGITLVVVVTREGCFCKNSFTTSGWSDWAARWIWKRWEHFFYWSMKISVSQRCLQNVQSAQLWVRARWSVFPQVFVCPLAETQPHFPHPLFLHRQKEMVGIKWSCNIFNWQKCPQEHPPFIYLLLARRAEFTSPLDLSACPAEKVYPRTFTYYTSMCPDCRLLGRTWLDQSKTHQPEDVLTGFCPKSSVLSTLAPRLIRVSQAACIPAIAARCRGVCFFCKPFLF